MEIIFLLHFLLALRIQTLFCRHWETLKDSRPACIIIRLVFSTWRIAFKQEGWFPGIGGGVGGGVEPGWWL